MAACCLRVAVQSDDQELLRDHCLLVNIGLVTVVLPEITVLDLHTYPGPLIMEDSHGLAHAFEGLSSRLPNVTEVDISGHAEITSKTLSALQQSFLKLIKIRWSDVTQTKNVGGEQLVKLAAAGVVIAGATRELRVDLNQLFEEFRGAVLRRARQVLSLSDGELRQLNALENSQCIEAWEALLHYHERTKQAPKVPKPFFSGPPYN